MTDLQYQPSTDVLAAGTYGRGVIKATIGDISPPTVHIAIPMDECRIGPIEGQTVVVDSTIQPADNFTTYTYAWTVNGAQPAPNEDSKRSKVKIIAPSPAQQVQLSLSVSDDDGFVGTATETFTPHTFQEAATIRFLCRLQHLAREDIALIEWLVRHIPQPDPGPIDRFRDPFRDVNVLAVTEANLEGVLGIGEQVLGIAEQIVSNARSALVAFKQAGASVRIGKLPTQVQMNDRLGEAEHLRGR